MRPTLSIAGAALALASTALARSDNCQIHSATYGKYDLRGLRKSSGDYEVENSNGDMYNLKSVPLRPPFTSPRRVKLIGSLVWPALLLQLLRPK